MSTVDPDARGRNPAVVALVAVGTVLVLALLWFFVVSPLLSDGEEEDDFVVTRPVVPEDEQTAPPDPEDQLAALPVETYEIFLSRDPFEPVVPAPADGNGGTDTDGDGVPDVVIVDGDGDGIPDADDDDGDGVPDDGDGTDGDGDVQHNAVLIDVFTDDAGNPRALVRVDDRIYTVGEGDEFADGYAVVAIDGTCVTFTYQGMAFTLCEGGTPPPGDGDGTDGGTDGSDSGPCRGTDTVVCEGRTVTLIDVYVTGDGEAVAVVQVDSTLYEVGRGDTFAQNFQVVSIDPPCVTLLYGDDAFTLCEGERTLK